MLNKQLQPSLTMGWLEIQNYTNIVFRMHVKVETLLPEGDGRDTPDGDQIPRHISPSYTSEHQR